MFGEINMLSKLEFLEEKYLDLSNKIGDPEVIRNQNEWKKLVKEHSSLEPIVLKYRAHKKASESLVEVKDIMYDRTADDELKEMAKMEMEELQESIMAYEEDLKVLLLPKDPNDDKNVIVEIRAGAGGDEAGLFAAVLFRMYTRYAEENKWKTELMSLGETGVGGYKEVIFMIIGKGAYSKLKYESGTHRVQRVPVTDSGGRIHTSTATVAVLPEADDVELEIHQNDLRIDVFRASGCGGQSVNTTDSAVRITHLPTGVIATCQDEKSQLKNKEKALKILKARIMDTVVQQQKDEIAEDRRSQVGTGDRSERIRTYNYPQGRITDHRINLTVYKLDAFLEGDINDMIDALITSDQANKLKQVN